MCLLSLIYVHTKLFFDMFLKKWCDVELNDAFKMPKPNEFIATNFDIKPRSEEVM